MGERQIELRDGHILLGGRVIEEPREKNGKDNVSENNVSCRIRK
jgi:hypothetical protein